MPLMGGFEFLRELEKLKGSENTKVFIFTSSIDPDDQQRANEYKVVDQFVEKPLTVDKLKLISENSLEITFTGGKVKSPKGP